MRLAITVSCTSLVPPSIELPRERSQSARAWPVPAGQHVAPLGEDLRVGDMALASGTLIGPD